MRIAKMRRADPSVPPVTESTAVSLMAMLSHAASPVHLQDALRESQKLREENAVLRKQIETLQAKLRSLHEQVAWLSQQLFGVKSERRPMSTLQLVLESIVLHDGQKATETSPSPDGAPVLETDASSAQDATPSPPPSPPGRQDKAPKHTPHGRGILPEHLSIEDAPCDEEIPEGSRVIGEEASFRLAFRKAGYIRLRVVRKKFARDNEDASTTVYVAPMPDEMIPRCLADFSMLAHVVHSKWGDHIPYTRLSKIIARSGIHLTVSTLSSWDKGCEVLARTVVDAAWQNALATCHMMGIDATGVRVMDTPHDRRAHIWVLLADRAQVFFRYSAHHSSDMPKSWLEGFQGPVVADASTPKKPIPLITWAPKRVGSPPPIFSVTYWFVIMTMVEPRQTRI